jgi:hypothetical protein
VQPHDRQAGGAVADKLRGLLGRVARHNQCLATHGSRQPRRDAGELFFGGGASVGVVRCGRDA